MSSHTEISSDTKCDFSTTQNSSTKRSKMLYELREKNFKCTLWWFQLLEGIDYFSLDVHFQSKYQTCYNHTLYGVWSSSLPVPDVGTKLSFCGNNFMISKFKINASNLHFFNLLHVLVPPKNLVGHMPLYDPIYC